MKPKINEGDFYAGITQVIDEGRHVDYLREVIRKYEEYKVKFEQSFTEKNPATAVYKFRVTYNNKERVWREIELLSKQTFESLAVEIIKSMGWDNDHMHGFELDEYQQGADPLMTGSSLAFFAEGWEDDPHPTFKTNEIRICDIDYKKRPTLEFTFDYGDGHFFDVKFVSRRGRHKQERVQDFPRLIDQRGVAPEQYPPLRE